MRRARRMLDPSRSGPGLLHPRSAAGAALTHDLCKALTPEAEGPGT